MKLLLPLAAVASLQGLVSRALHGISGVAAAVAFALLVAILVGSSLPFSLRKQIIERRNEGVAALTGAVVIAFAVVVASALRSR